MANGRLKIFFIHGKTAKPTGARGGYAWFRTDKSKCDWELLDDVTRNQAEYMAIVCVLRYVTPESRVLIYTDSQLIIDQYAGKCRVASPQLRKLARRVRRLIDEKRLDVKVRSRLDWEPNHAAIVLSQVLEFKRLGLPYGGR
jgi:ribonuclease HI